MAVELIVWDFDGVLNRNLVGGRFVWADHLQKDLGVDPKALSAFIFGAGAFLPVIRGQRDLLDLVQEFLDQAGHDIPARAFLSYWFEHDALPDHEVIGWLQAHPARHVIGTNNETRRAAFIEGPMGFSRLVSHVFCSGRLGVAKPEAGFFDAIQDWAGVPAQRIVLVDDTAANVVAARALGWQAYHFTEETRDGLPQAIGLE